MKRVFTTEDQHDRTPGVYPPDLSFRHKVDNSATYKLSATSEPPTVVHTEIPTRVPERYNTRGYLPGYLRGITIRGYLPGYLRGVYIHGDTYPGT